MIFCPNCKAARAANEAPCSICFAPSPMVGSPQKSAWGGPDASSLSWGGPASPDNGQRRSSGSLLSFGATSWSQPPFSQTSPTQSPPQSASAWRDAQAQPLSWPQTLAPQTAQAQQPTWTSGSAPQELEEQPIRQQSMLPVPYQGGAQLQAGPLMANAPQLIPAQTIEQMLPAIPEEEGMVYVPPMYTNPRPIIPRYRVISGFISFVIVCLLLCTGAGYYAKATGKFTAIKNLVVATTPPKAKPIQTQKIPDPPDKIDKGPAFNIINSATTTARIDPKTRFALQAQKVFQVDQTFYVTYSVQHPKEAGTVTVQWYMNDLPYLNPVQTKQIPAGATVNGDAPIRFRVPARGAVELLWNGQLAQKLYFSVK